LTQFDAASYQESTQLPSQNAILNNYIINWCKTIFSKIWILQLLSSRVWRISANSDLPPSLWNQTPKIQVKLFWSVLYSI